MVVGIYEPAVPVEKDKLVEPQVIPHIEHRPYRHKEDDEPEAQPELSPGSNVDNSHFCICFIPELLSKPRGVVRQYPVSVKEETREVPVVPRRSAHWLGRRKSIL